MNHSLDELDTVQTDAVVCPFCGEVLCDCWEYEGEELVVCDCGKTFRLEVDYSVTYSTYKPDWLQEWRKENRRVLMDKGLYSLAVRF